MLPSSVPAEVGHEERVPEKRGLFARQAIPTRALIVRAMCACASCASPFVCEQFGVYTIDAYQGSGRLQVPGGPTVAMTGIMQLANHSSTAPNAEFRAIEGLGVCLVSCRAIRAGEQILVDYGTTFDTRGFAVSP